MNSPRLNLAARVTAKKSVPRNSKWESSYQEPLRYASIIPADACGDGGGKIIKKKNYINQYVLIK
jgi:hypothetical protein